MKKRLLVGAILCSTLQLAAQTAQIGQPISWKGTIPLAKKTIEMPYVDNSAEQTAEMNRRATFHEKNLRFGKEQTVDIDVIQQAEILTLPNGDILRRLIIHSKNAVSINLIFSQFELVTGARLYIFNKAQTEYIGAHTALNNNVNRMLGTELIHSDAAIIELTEPAAVAGKSTLVLGTVVHGYFDLESEIKALNESDNCEYDVNCAVGVGWENQRNAVAMVIIAGDACTGSLLNNTSGTIIPYFLTANHCGTTPGSWVFRFRWESPAGQADCATAAPSVDAPTTMTVNGAVLRSSYAPTDFMLIELNTAPDPAWGVYYNGWNRTDVPATSATGIHHPEGDVKKISHEFDPVISTTPASSPANSHWGVTHWDQGITEPGSSGSPLFDQNHRTVGQLHTAFSYCGGLPNAWSDDYGKFSVSWAGGATNATRLSNWLDPNGTGVAFLDGVDPAGQGNTLDAELSGAEGVNSMYCSGTVTPHITITNNGSNVLTSATITYGFDGASNLTYNWTGNLSRYQASVVALPFATPGDGSHTFQATITNPNGGTDQNASNNGVNTSFSMAANDYPVELTLTLDCWGGETTWQVDDTVNNTVLFSGGPYANNYGGTIITATLCLNHGCYKFIINDAYGDGMTSSGCAVPTGNYSVTDNNGAEVAGLTAANANFGHINTQVFCIGIEGLSELSNQQTWAVYPNPTDKVLNIDMSTIDGQKTIVVMNTTGQIVNTIYSAAGQEAIQVSGLAKGVYFVSLTSEKGTATKTFIVK